MDLDQARAIALALPGATEEPHFDKTSFRVRGKLFASAPPDGNHLHIFVDAHAVDAVVASNPGCEPLWWGKRVLGVRVPLASVDEALVADLLEDAWQAKGGWYNEAGGDRQ